MRISDWSSDVCSSDLSVRDIRIAIDGETRHYWPLNESTGTVAHDVLSGLDARVINPEWILHDFQYWQLHQRTGFSGPVSLAFNPENESDLVFSTDSLTIIPIGPDPPKIGIGSCRERMGT